MRNFMAIAPNLPEMLARLIAPFPNNCTSESTRFDSAGHRLTKFKVVGYNAN
jgi:hypothetical protein